MKPLAITHFTCVNSLGAGTVALQGALREGRSGLAPCAFETVTLDTHVGEVAGVADKPVRPDLAPYDCRNNRLAQFALEQDGFAAAVAAAAARVGAARIGVFLGTSTSGILS